MARSRAASAPAASRVASREVEGGLGGEERRSRASSNSSTARSQSGEVGTGDPGRVVERGRWRAPPGRTTPARRAARRPWRHHRTGRRRAAASPRAHAHPAPRRPGRPAGAPRARRRRHDAPSPTNRPPGHDRCGTDRCSRHRARARRLDRCRGTRPRRRRRGAEPCQPATAPIARRRTRRERGDSRA